MNNFLTSLTQSQKLKAIGVPQVSKYFYCGVDLYVKTLKYGRSSQVYYINVLDMSEWFSDEDVFERGITLVSAYLSDELLMMFGGSLDINSAGKSFRIKYLSSDMHTYHAKPGKSLPDALAELLSFLIEQKILSVEDLKI